ncbi:serine/threonine protein phosphatase [Candidatus Aerophobetes bacterium]|uniref:Serine/threonine protein phosphatase n=1 Tax=Aerophobetes bacterium TaxID=2030807 RepID=A0A523W8U2_UNCAE|nr:MAG: serine/threonine protein phosphatase [Candidatus Aerophobetes bacterium]
MTKMEELARKASSCSVDEFCHLIRGVISSLTEEKSKSLRGAVKREGGLIYLPSKGKVLVIGDLHGDLDSLVFILKSSKLLERLTRENDVFAVFLGDYGDRGSYPAEVYHIVLTLRSIFREKIVMLRGNHEGPEDMTFRPHDLPYFLRRRFGEGWRKVYVELRQLFDLLYHSAVVEGKYLMLHGGLPENVNSLSDIAWAHDAHPAKSYLEEILWNDPGEEEMSSPSPRGAGRIFASKVTNTTLNRLGVKTLIRSHEPCDGTAVQQKGRILTLFSRKGPPYYNSQAAYLEIDLAREAMDAYELARQAHHF